LKYTEIGQFVGQGNKVLIVGDFILRYFVHNSDENDTPKDTRLRELSCIIKVAELESYNAVTTHQGKMLDLVLVIKLGSVTVIERTSLTDLPDEYDITLLST